MKHMILAAAASLALAAASHAEAPRSGATPGAAARELRELLAEPVFASDPLDDLGLASPGQPRSRSFLAAEDRRDREVLLADSHGAPSAGASGSSAPRDAAAAKQAELDAIGEAMANPLSYLWLLFTQNDTIWNDGNILDDLDKDPRPQNVFMLNPVLSVQLTEEWKTIFRPVIPINSFATVDNVNVSLSSPGGVTGVDRDRKTGLGDIVLWTAFSNQYTPPFVWGLGPTMMLNTATDEQLGTGKWAAGPMGLAFYIDDNWIIGTIAQHWESFAGSDTVEVDTNFGSRRVSRPDVSLTDVQYVLRYRLSQTTNIGMAPNIRYNWESDELSLPIGGGADTLIKIGPLPVKIGLEAYYYVASDEDFGPEWQLRFLFVPVIPSPEWSRKPIFN